MWIALAIIAALASLITLICLLPVKVILKNDENNALIVRVKVLFLTVVGESKRDKPAKKKKEKSGGVAGFGKKHLQKSIEKDGLKETVTSTYEMVTNLLKEVVGLLRRCAITRLFVQIRCTGDDPAEAAVHYGQVCTATYSLLNLLDGFVKIRRRKCQIDIGCDFFESQPIFRYELILRATVGRALFTGLRVFLAELKRTKVKKK